MSIKNSVPRTAVSFESLTKGLNKMLPTIEDVEAVEMNVSKEKRMFSSGFNTIIDSSRLTSTSKMPTAAQRS